MILDPVSYFGQSLRDRRSAGLRLTLMRYPPGQAQPWHVHAYPTLFLLLSGRNCDQARHYTHDQAALTLVFHPTTEPHAAQVGPHGMVGLNVELEPAWLARHDLRGRDLGGYRPLDSLRLRLEATRLVTCAFQEGRCTGADLESQTLELLTPLVSPSWPTEPSLAPPWLRRAETFLHDQFREPISLRDVALEVSVHPVHLARVFRRRYGCPVSAYLRALRVAEASRLILEEGWTVGAAAHEAGFADQAHLSRSCTQELGRPPKTLRAARKLFLR
jgi:AraC family transcriptional regulator